jgi:radical SAM protein with 4Fe4S-binding SPASM domain
MTAETEPRDAIRYIQIETGTVCNYRCRYCPVSYHPRPGGFMSLEIVQKIARSLDSFPNLAQIYLNGYDEPTLNHDLVTIVRLLARIPARITLLTNGTRLTPALADELAATGANIEFDIHLSSVDRGEFERIHQSKLFDKVMRNLEYLTTFPHLGRIEVHVSMQGREDERDNQLFAQIQTEFANTPFHVKKYFPNDRAGLLKNEYNLNIYRKTLRGCALQNRTHDWLHINATGKVILCCQDYSEEYVIGDINVQDLLEIVTSEARRLYHQWTTGKILAPDDYMCRRCLFAITDDCNA